MLGILKFKRERNYNIVSSALKNAGVDTVEKATQSIEQTIKNGFSATTLLLLVTAILSIAIPSGRAMVIGIGLILLAWIWASVYNGKQHIEKYTKENILKSKD